MIISSFDVVLITNTAIEVYDGVNKLLFAYNISDYKGKDSYIHCDDDCTDGHGQNYEIWSRSK